MILMNYRVEVLRFSGSVLTPFPSGNPQEGSDYWDQLAGSGARIFDTGYPSFSDNAGTNGADVFSKNPIRSISEAVGRGVALVKTLAALGDDCHFQVWGKPIGAPEGDNPDLSLADKQERLYVRADTMTRKLRAAITDANRTASSGPGYEVQDSGNERITP